MNNNSDNDGSGDEGMVKPSSGNKWLKWSVQCVMSRVEIMSNRMWSTMDDGWFTALIILASERKILGNLPANNIIDSFSNISLKLRTILGM